MPRFKTIAGPDGGIQVPFTPEEEAQRDREEAEALALQEATQYAQNRRKAYPALEEQLDLLWHDMDDGKVIGRNGEWYYIIKAIKEANPKPVK